MDRKQTILNFYPTIFFLFIVFLIPLGTFFNQETISKSEKRKLASFPSLHPINSFPRSFEDFINDNFAFRDILTFHRNYIIFKFFDKSPITKVVLGQNGWLFYSDGNSIQDYRGLKELSQQQIANWHKTIMGKKKWFESQGIKYFFLVAPNKQTIYPEHFPVNMNKTGKNTCLEQVLNISPNSTIIDLRKPLLKAKNNDNPLYFKKNTHWNSKGAFEAYAYIMQRLGINPMARSSLRETPQSIRCDLSVMLGLENILTEKSAELEVSSPCSKEYEMTFLNKLKNDYKIRSIFAKECKTSSTRPVAIVFRDSFFTNLEPFVSEHFKLVVYVWHKYDKKLATVLINKVNPDIVIEERAERVVATSLLL